jgi:hypothetical protein
VTREKNKKDIRIPQNKTRFRSHCSKKVGLLSQTCVTQVHECRHGQRGCFSCAGALKLKSFGKGGVEIRLHAQLREGFKNTELRDS